MAKGRPVSFLKERVTRPKAPLPENARRRRAIRARCRDGDFGRRARRGCDLAERSDNEQKTVRGAEPRTRAQSSASSCWACVHEMQVRETMLVAVGHAESKAWKRQG
eukprot:6201103-Pleurochrysis_carterae.AAC.1